MVRWLTIAFVAGISTGVAVSRGLTADWVAAVGTWVGALATIATIIWAVHAFRRDRQSQLEDRDRGVLGVRAAAVELAPATAARKLFDEFIAQWKHCSGQTVTITKEDRVHVMWYVKVGERRVRPVIDDDQQLVG